MIKLHYYNILFKARDINADDITILNRKGQMSWSGPQKYARSFKASNKENAIVKWQSKWPNYDFISCTEVTLEQCKAYALLGTHGN